MNLEMTTEFAKSMQNISYNKYMFSLLVAIVFLCISRLVLQGSGVEGELYRYFGPLMVGGSIGYLTGYFYQQWQKSMYLGQKASLKLKNTIKKQSKCDAWYKALFQKNKSVLMLINSTTGLIEEANPSACEFYGYSIKQLKQLHISELNALPKEETDSEMARAKSEGRQQLFFKHRLASGEAKDVEVLSSSISIDETSFLFSVVKDISEQKVLRGIIPICAHCKQIRGNQGNWSQIEEYIQRHSEANFSHGVCPSCVQEHYPTVYELYKNEYCEQV